MDSFLGDITTAFTNALGSECAGVLNVSFTLHTNEAVASSMS